MKKISKLMTAACCAVVLGGAGLSLYAATSAGSPATRAAEEEGQTIIAYGRSITNPNNIVVDNGLVSESSFCSSSNYFVFFWGYGADGQPIANRQVSSTNTSAGSVKIVGANGYEDTVSANDFSSQVNSVNGFKGLMLYSYTMGWLSAGEYTLTIPAGFVTFQNDGGENEETTFSFTIVGDMYGEANFDSQYVAPSVVKEGLSYTFGAVTSVSLVAGKGDTQIDIRVGEETKQITANDINILDNTITLPPIDAENNQRISYTIPGGLWEGVSESGAKYISSAIENYGVTVWDGMTTSASLVDRVPQYVTELEVLKVQWQGQKIHLVEPYASNNEIPVTISGQMKNLPCVIVEEGETSYLEIYDILEDVNTAEGNVDVNISLPKGIVANEDGQVNLEANRIASFTLAVFWEGSNFAPEIQGPTILGKVSLYWSDSYYVQDTNAVTNPVEILDKDKNVVLQITPERNWNFYPGTQYNFDISTLPKNESYTLRISPMAFSVNSTSNWNSSYCNPAIEKSFTFTVDIPKDKEGELGTDVAVYSGLDKYNNTENYYKPTNSIIVTWEKDGKNVEVGVLDASKLVVTSKGEKVRGDIQIEKFSQQGNYSWELNDYEYTYGLKITLPASYKSDYGEFVYTFQEGFVYDSDSMTNDLCNVTFSTYGELPSANITWSPASTGDVRSSDLKTLTFDVAAELNNDGNETIVSLTTGKGQIEVYNSRYEQVYLVPATAITTKGTTMTVDLSGYTFENGSYSIYVREGTLIADTDFGNNWINPFLNIAYTVWNGLPQPEITGLTGSVTLGSVESFNGIYTLTWDENIKPTDSFSLTYYATGYGYENYTPERGDIDRENVTIENGVLTVDVTSVLEKTLLDPEAFLDFINFTLAQGSVEGSDATAINKGITFASIQIRTATDVTASISGPVNGIVTIEWPSQYWVVNVSNDTSKGLELQDINGNLIGTYTFTTGFDAWRSGELNPQPEGYPLQFIMRSGANGANGFTLNLNECGLEPGKAQYKVVIPEGWLYIVEESKRNEYTPVPPINPSQSETITYASYLPYDGEINITPEQGAEAVEELPTVTVEFVDGTNVELVGSVYVNGKPLAADAVEVIKNQIIITPGVTESGEVKIEIPVGVVIIDGVYQNDDIVTAKYTVDIPTGIYGIQAVDGRYEVYTIAGVRVLSTDNAAALNALENGLYIINGKKVLIRK